MNKVVQPRLIPSNTRRLVVTQANALASSIQDMTLLEKRVILLALAVIRRSDVALPFVRVYISDLRRVYGIKSNSLSNAIDEATSKLMTRFAAFPRGQGSYSKYSWANEAHFTSGLDSDDGQAYLDIQLHSQLSAFVLQLTGKFQSIPLSILSKFQSWYALRICEILYHESHGGKIERLSFDLDNLKDILSCNTKTYANFADFRRRILDVAEEENREIGFLTFSYEPLKRGRKVSGLEFSLEVNLEAFEYDELTTAESGEAVSDVLDRITLENSMRERGFTENPRPFIEALGTDVVNLIFKQCREEERQNKGTAQEIKNFGAYLHHKLKQVRENPLPLQVASADTRSKLGRSGTGAPGEAKRADGQEISKLADTLVQTLSMDRMQHALDCWASLDTEEQEALRERMIHELDHYHLRLLEESNWDGMHYRNAIKKMLELGGLEYPPNLASLRVYVDDRGLFTEFDDKTREKILAAAENSL
jgi:plasmid replication initiation protein